MSLMDIKLLIESFIKQAQEDVMSLTQIKHMATKIAQLADQEIQSPTPIPELLKSENLTLKEPMASIVLEVGHGAHPDGFEPGAVDDRTGTREWDMNKVCAQACESKLKSMGYHNVLVTDQNDYLFQIGKKHHDSKVFVSVHHNAFSNPEAQGSETLVHKTKADASDRKLATILSDKMSKALGIHNRGVKTMSLSVLSGAIHDHHADSQGVVLVEPYFITGDDVTDHSAWSTKAGVAIAEGIHEYLSSVS